MSRVAAGSPNNMLGTSPIPQSYFWSNFDQGQKKWPIPSATLLVLFFLAGCTLPLVGGVQGLILAFIGAAFFPSKHIRDFLPKGDILSILSVTTAAMMVGNFDAIGDILGSDTVRFSWIFLVLSGLVIPFRVQRLRGRIGICCVVVGILLGFNIFSSLGNTELLRAVEINGSYLAAYLLISINLVRRKTRDTFVYHLVLIIAINCGFSLFEILFPGNSISISSSRIGEQTVRSAGIYANAITSGLMATNTLLLVSICSTKTNAGSKEKLALFVFMGICGIGVLVTFSRSAVLCLFMAGVVSAFRLANNRFGKLMQYAPFVLAMLLISVLGAGEYLSQRGGLRRDATSRYDMVKEAMSGNMAPVFEAMQQRTTAWQPSRRYWEKPKAAGYGFNIISERQLYMPHNMVILTLAETGWIGLLIFIATVLYLSGFGQWKMTSQNMVLFASVFLPLIFIILESHSLFTRRYFAIYLALLAFASSVLLMPGNKENR